MPHRFARHLTGSVRSRRGDIQLGLALAFIAGAINAGGFLAVGQYTSHMTGVLSTVADLIALHKFHAALISVLFVACFICGAITSSVVISWGRARKFHSEFALALMLEALLLLVFAFYADNLFRQAESSINTIIALLCFIMGLQNAIITKISSAEIRTTHVTGLVTDIGIELGKYIYSSGSKALRAEVKFKKLALHSGLVCSFLSGGIIGATAFNIFGTTAAIPFAIILMLMASVPVLDDLRGRKLDKD